MCSTVSTGSDDAGSGWQQWHRWLVLPAHQFDQVLTVLLLPPRNCLHPYKPDPYASSPEEGKEAPPIQKAQGFVYVTQGAAAHN